MIKISKPSKMKIAGKRVGCWSLEARKSCPGSVNPDGSIVDVCKSCYATKGMYRFPVVKNARKVNKADYMEEDWVERMVAEVSKYDYFRWFDSGDVESHELLYKIHSVVARTSKTRHWLPTRSDKVQEVNTGFKNWAWTNNVAIRPSADHIGLNNKERPGVNSFVIKPEEIFEAKKRGIHVCPVGVNPKQKSCDNCTMCYTNAEVAYVLH